MGTLLCAFLFDYKLRKGKGAIDLFLIMDRNQFDSNVYLKNKLNWAYGTWSLVLTQNTWRIVLGVKGLVAENLKQTNK